MITFESIFFPKKAGFRKQLRNLFLRSDHSIYKDVNIAENDKFCICYDRKNDNLEDFAKIKFVANLQKWQYKILKQEFDKFLINKK